MTGQIDFTLETCVNCGVPFYMTTDLNTRLRNNPGTKFYCPNGHDMWYTGKSEEQKLREKLKTVTNEVNWYQRRLADETSEHECTQRRLSSTKGHLTRAKNELQKGNCPCCDEHFADLELHIAEKHPDFDLEPADEQEVTPPKAKRGRPRKVRETEDANA